MNAMKVAAVTALIVSLGAMSVLHSQDFPRVEVFAGYSFLNIDGNRLTTRQTAHGGESSVTVNFTRYFGLEDAVSGYTISGLGLGFAPPTVNVDVRDYSLLTGPRINIHPVFVHALFGFDHLSGSTAGFSASQGNFASAYGLGAEWNYSPHVGVRFSADYVLTRHNIFGGPPVNQNNFRVGAGLVFTFGRHETIPRAQSTPQSYPAPVPQPNSTRTSASDVPLLGVSGYPSVNGFNVTAVAPGSPADTQVHMEARDLIVLVDGQPVHTAQDIEQAIGKSQTGTVRIAYLIRGIVGNARDVKVR